jgi:hypothetical protein
MVVTPSFTHLSIIFQLSEVKKCSPTATPDVGFVKLTSDNFCGNRTFKVSPAVTCAALVV